MCILLLRGGTICIGSDFAHDLVQHSDGQIASLAKFTYAASRESLARLADLSGPVGGDIADPDRLVSVNGFVRLSQLKGLVEWDLVPPTPTTGQVEPTRTRLRKPGLGRRLREACGA